MPMIATITMSNAANASEALVQRLRALTEFAIDAWGGLLAGSARINVTVAIVESTPAGRAEGGPDNLVFVGTDANRNVFEPSTAYELRTGASALGAGADMVLRFQRSYLETLFIDPTPSNAGDLGNQVDGLSVLLHEIGHALGFTGYYREATDTFDFGASTPFDTRLTLRSGAVFFDGPNVRALYGRPVPLTDNNYTHYGNSAAFPPTTNDPLVGLMNGVAFFLGYRYSISPLDLAILADLGFGTHANDIFDLPYMHTFTGGRGDDRYIFRSTSDVAIERDGEGVDTVVAYANYTLGANVENLELVGAVAGTGNALANRIVGSDQANTLFGAGGNDVLSGGAGADSLNGEDGGDVLIGGLGADAINGGIGIDTASYEDNWGGVFINLLSGRGYGNAAEGDTLTAIENVRGGHLPDAFIGDGGVNRIEGLGGNDVLIGGPGADVLDGGSGSDTASYEDNWGGVFINLLSGQGYGNAAEGDTYAGIENLRGGIFADGLLGDNGANRLAGGLGADTLYGLGGTDTFVFDTAPSAANADTVTDFVAGTDRIELARSSYGALATGGLPPGAFVNSASASLLDQRLIYNGFTGQLFYDPDGSDAAAAVLIATFQGAPDVTAADFLVI